MNIQKRLVFFLVLILLSFGLIIYRLFTLSYLKHSSYRELAQNQEKYGNFSSRRGDLFIKDQADDKLVTAATTKKKYYAYFTPNSISNPDEVINKIIGIVNLDPDKTLDLITDSKSGFKILSEDLTFNQIEQIKSLNIKGVQIGVKNERFYPQHELASDVIGFLGFKGDQRVGQYGVEGFYDQSLKNQAQSLVLTVDSNIQFFVEEKLKQVIEKWQAQSGSVIVQDPKTGAILAMADFPNFNLNEYGKYELERFINSNIQEIFEPGSSFKPITMAGAIDSGLLKPQSTYYDPGFVELAGYRLKNFDEKSHGLQTMNQVLEKSLNTGAIHASKLMGSSKFLAYIEAFGFGRKTDIDVFGEVSGDISNLYLKRPINFATASFGQGIAVTPIQLINGYSSIANGGKQMKPYIIEELVLKNGDRIKTQPRVISRPISEASGRTLRSMLVSVVDRGFDKARIKGYEIAGKTGTAQIPNKDKEGYSDEFIHNFVGFAPANDPRFTVLLKIDRPKGIKFAADSLSPVFGEISRFLINYYSIPPTR